MSKNEYLNQVFQAVRFNPNDFRLAYSRVYQAGASVMALYSALSVIGNSQNLPARAESAAVEGTAASLSFLTLGGLAAELLEFGDPSAPVRLDNGAVPGIFSPFNSRDGRLVMCAPGCLENVGDLYAEVVKIYGLETWANGEKKVVGATSDIWAQYWKTGEFHRITGLKIRAGAVILLTQKEPSPFKITFSIEGE